MGADVIAAIVTMLTDAWQSHSSCLQSPYKVEPVTVSLQRRGTENFSYLSKITQVQLFIQNHTSQSWDMNPILGISKGCGLRILTVT